MAKSKKRKRLFGLDIGAIAIVDSPANQIPLYFAKSEDRGGFDENCAPGFHCTSGPTPVAKADVVGVLSPAEYGRLCALDSADLIAGQSDFNLQNVAGAICEVASGEGRTFTAAEGLLAAESFVSTALYGDESVDDVVSEAMAELVT